MFSDGAVEPLTGAILALKSCEIGPGVVWA
jgi:hypothetical protein